MKKILVTLLILFGVVFVPHIANVAHAHKKRPGNTPKPHAVKHRCVDIQAGPKHPNLHRNK